MTDLMYEEGDVVHVRDDLVIGRLYGECRFVPGMAHAKGNLVTIRQVLPANLWFKQNTYRIQEDSGWVWSAEMFDQLSTAANIDVDEFI